MPLNKEVKPNLINEEFQFIIFNYRKIITFSSLLQKSKIWKEKYWTYKLRRQNVGSRSKLYEDH